MARTVGLQVKPRPKEEMPKEENPKEEIPKDPLAVKGGKERDGL